VRKNETTDAMAQQLSDDDLRDISAYYASPPGPDGPKTPDTAPQETELGAKIAAGIHCTNCHGDTATSSFFRIEDEPTSIGVVGLIVAGGRRSSMTALYLASSCRHSSFFLIKSVQSL